MHNALRWAVGLFAWRVRPSTPPPHTNGKAEQQRKLFVDPWRADCSGNCARPPEVGISPSTDVSNFPRQNERKPKDRPGDRPAPATAELGQVVNHEPLFETLNCLLQGYRGVSPTKAAFLAGGSDLRLYPDSLAVAYGNWLLIEFLVKWCMRWERGDWRELRDLLGEAELRLDWLDGHFNAFSRKEA